MHSGDLVLIIPGGKFDAVGLPQLAGAGLDSLVQFRHIERSKDWNLLALRALFDFLKLAPGMAGLVTQGEVEPVQKMQEATASELERLVRLQRSLREGLSFWEQELLTPEEIQQFHTKLNEVQRFLESLQAFSSPGKLKNFSCDVQSIAKQRDSLSALNQLSPLSDLALDFRSAAQFLSAAAAMLPPSHGWLSEMKRVRGEVLAQLGDPSKRSAANFRQQTKQKLTALKDSYEQTYLELHSRARLTVEEDQHKQELMRSQRLRKLKSLASIAIMPRQHLADFEDNLAGLTSCFALTRLDLRDAVCPHCGFRPVEEVLSTPVKQRLESLNRELDFLTARWTQVLLTNLEDQVSKLELLQIEPRRQVEGFMKKKELPDDLTPEFVDALRDVLSGLQKVSVKTLELQKALLVDGLPTTPMEMKKRFETFMDTLTTGMDPKKIRIVLE